MVNRRTHSAPRRGLRGARSPRPGNSRVAAIRCIQCPVASRSELRPHAYEVFRGLVDIDDFDVAAAVAGAPGSLKCMRRNSIIRARNSRIGGRVLPWLEYRAGNEQVRRVRLHREAHLLAADRRALHQPGLLMPCMDMRCFARGRPDNPQRRRRPRRRGDGRLGQRRSVVRSRQGNASATTRNDRECAMRASNAADRTSSVNDGTVRRVPGPSKIRGPMARGCGTGLIHCGGQTGRRFAAEMR